MADEPHGKLGSNESAHAVSRAIGTVLLAIGWAAAYWVWPTGIMDAPLGSVTVMASLRMLGAGALVVFALYTAVMLWIE